MKLSYSHISQKNDFLIIIHQKPDGDCVGAALTFSRLLDRLGKKNVILIKDIVPEKLKYLPGWKKIIEAKNDTSLINFKAFKVLVFLDCATLEMSGFSPKDFDGKEIINIDHHPTNPNFGNINFVQAEKCSVCEILFDLFRKWQVKIDKEMAVNLFSGIFTDTGGFQHSNTSLTVLKKAAELQKFGINIGKISKTVFMTKSIGALKLLGLALSRLKYNKQYNLVYSIISKEDQERLNSAEEDLEGIAYVIGKCPNVNATMFVYQLDSGCIKGSLRTEKEGIDVSRLATVLNGGGHKQASGFKFPGKIKNKSNHWIVL